MISRQYIIAMAFSMFKYYIEVAFLPELKAQWWITNIGLLMVLTGEAIRKAAILTAGSAFTHIIRVDHDDHHELIIRGIYW
ncbi:Protein-S-isoprenylcysteine O-methyltransferase A [Platanthera guangdongensis]|uniref:Protein-S-isoprenylcysteine O-methyltransferase n=1 Tax=Platanthera guangdongensis TaxID=2320717 RepID=A0ABR2M6A2_9ASPA